MNAKPARAKGRLIFYLSVLTFPAITVIVWLATQKLALVILLAIASIFAILARVYVFLEARRTRRGARN